MDRSRPAVDYSRFDFLDVQIGEDGVAVTTLNAPDTLNAIGPQNHWQLEDVWLELGRDERIKVIVLTGAGAAFSAGGDVKQLAGRAGSAEGLAYALGVPGEVMRLCERLLACPQPIIAAVNGDCFGLGTSLMAFSDISLVAEDARLGDTHVKVGLVAGDGGSVMFPLLLGPQKAKELLMRGKVLSGRQAADLGLCNHAHPRAEVLDEALKMAREVAAQPLWAVRWTKAAVNRQVKAQLQAVLETSAAYEALSMLTGDHKEAATAFAEKRRPVFKGN